MPSKDSVSTGVQVALAVGLPAFILGMAVAMVFVLDPAARPAAVGPPPVKNFLELVCHVQVGHVIGPIKSDLLEVTLDHCTETYAEDQVFTTRCLNAGAAVVDDEGDALSVNLTEQCISHVQSEGLNSTQPRAVRKAAKEWSGSLEQDALQEHVAAKVHAEFAEFKELANYINGEKNKTSGGNTTSTTSAAPSNTTAAPSSTTRASSGGNSTTGPPVPDDFFDKPSHTNTTNSTNNTRLFSIGGALRGSIASDSSVLATSFAITALIAMTVVVFVYQGVQRRRSTQTVYCVQATGDQLMAREGSRECRVLLG